MSRPRVDASPSFRKLSFEFGGFKVKYAYASQPGYYPDDLTKENQDAHIEVEELSPKESESSGMAFFGVFDGHGMTGAQCATYVRDNLPSALKQKLKEHEKDFELAHKKAFTEVNTRLHSDPSVEDSLSGTTATTCLIHNGHVYVANLGDSRAVLARRKGNDDEKLEVMPLSSDQTPYRKDERERVKLCGARVATIDQLEGVTPMGDDYGNDEESGGHRAEGDPPRVWLPNSFSPGCAFTRSIGDQVGETIGVIAEPEVLRHQLCGLDQFIMLASDGVWEFLSNQAVTEIVNKCKSPLKAAKAVVQEAYKLWLQNDVRTDDITIICICFEEMGEIDNAHAMAGST